LVDSGVIADRDAACCVDGDGVIADAAVDDDLEMRCVVQLLAVTGSPTMMAWWIRSNGDNAS
jgi:hypothetical protein